ncbi:hypothetical protein [Elizabethkingia miricola]|uniref:hypothetical protein n=1 Tax=Elizabethkingia miricola TaxID=172045 RepID=UPI00099A667F|nr:hypothetical protein [Elizabethkingia miricola]OPC37702.1 hypothetical protein BAX99_16595 [Elizabethkingia miricola]
MELFLRIKVKDQPRFRELCKICDVTFKIMGGVFYTMTVLLTGECNNIIRLVWFFGSEPIEITVLNETPEYI